MQLRQPRGPARKARIHTGEVRRPQYELMSLINELRMAHDASVSRRENRSAKWAESRLMPLALFDGNRLHDIVETCGACHKGRPERNPQ
jgi:hypothetical protein